MTMNIEPYIYPLEEAGAGVADVYILRGSSRMTMDIERGHFGQVRRLRGVILDNFTNRQNGGTVSRSTSEILTRPSLSRKPSNFG